MEATCHHNWHFKKNLRLLTNDFKDAADEKKKDATDELQGSTESQQIPGSQQYSTVLLDVTARGY